MQSEKSKKSPPRANLKVNKGDQFFDFFAQIFQWVALHQAKFYGLILLIVMSFGAYGIWIYLENQRSNDLASFYYNASTAPADQAAAAWQKLIDKRPYAKLLSVAELQLASLDADQKKYLEAAQKFEKSGLKAPAYFNNLSELAAANSYENAQKFAEAEKIYQKVSNDPKNPFRAWASLGLARCWLQLNKKTEAQKLFEQLASEPNSIIQSAAQTALLAQLLQTP